MKTLLSINQRGINSCFLKLFSAIAIVVVLLNFSNNCKGEVSGPYTPDSNTLFLFHFDESDGLVATTNSGSIGGNAFAVNCNPASATPPTVTGVLGAASYTGFGNCANVGLGSGYLLGFDGNFSGAYEGDVSGTVLSADRIALSTLGIGVGPFTLEAMIYPTSSAGNREIITTDSSAGTRGFQFRLTTGGTTGQRLEFNLIGVSGAQRFADIPITGSHAFTLNKWFHVAFVYDGTYAKFYWTAVDPSSLVANQIGGDQALTIPSSAASITGPLTFGNENRNVSGENLWGMIDEVRISNIARSPTNMLFNPGNVDVVPPVITNGPVYITAVATSAEGAYVNYTPPTAIDDRDGEIAVVCNPPPGALFPIGNTLVTCTATDSTTNTSVYKFYVTVFSAAPEDLMFLDTFDIWYSTYDVNAEYQYEYRQYGLLAPLDYTESDRTTNGGPMDFQTQLDESHLVFMPTNPPAEYRLATVSPNHNFKEGSEFTIEFDLDAGTNDVANASTDWAAIIFGSSSSNVSVNASGNGIGILFRNNGFMQVFDGATLVYDGSGITGGHIPYDQFHVKISVSAAAYEGSPALIALWVNDNFIKLSTNGPYIKQSGLRDNWITLAGYGNTNWVHIFDNFSVKMRQHIRTMPSTVIAHKGMNPNALKITVPASVLASNNVSVTVTSTDPSVAEPVGAVNGSVQLQFNSQTTNEQYIDVQVYKPGAAAFNISGPGGILLSPNAVSVVVTNANPVAANYGGAMAMGAEFSIPIAELLAKCFDADGDTLSLLNVDSMSTNGAAVEIYDDAIVFTPWPDYVGIDGFTYTISDEQGGTATGSIVVNVLDTAVPERNTVRILKPSSGGFRLIYSGEPGAAYSIERATDINGPWTSIFTGQSPVHTIIDFVDTNPPQGTGFYRIKRQE
ncbi:MAG: cadherin-like domain-containing protein [Verrucomicrobiia bacterium]